MFIECIVEYNYKKLPIRKKDKENIIFQTPPTLDIQSMIFLDYLKCEISSSDI